MALSLKWRCIGVPRLAADDEAAPNSSVVASMAIREATWIIEYMAASSSRVNGSPVRCPRPPVVPLVLLDRVPRHHRLEVRVLGQQDLLVLVQRALGRADHRDHQARV